MEADGTIVLMLRAEGPGGIIGDAQLRYEKSHPKYEETLRHLGGLKPGEEKPVPPWPDSPSEKRPAALPKALKLPRSCGGDRGEAVVLLAARTDPKAQAEIDRFAATLSFLALTRTLLRRDQAKGAWDCLEGGVKELADKYLYGDAADTTVEELEAAKALAKQKKWVEATQAGVAALEKRLTRKSRQLRHYLHAFRIDQYEPGSVALDENAARERATVLAERAAKADQKGSGGEVEFGAKKWQVRRLGTGWHLEIAPPAGWFAEVSFDQFGGVPTVGVSFANH